MFFSRRATQAEYFDLPDRSHKELVEGYDSLAKVNRMLVFAEPFQRYLPRYFGHDQCANLSFLDVGAGDGLLGRVLSQWAREKHGWNWEFTNLDICAAALKLNPDGNNVVGSALDIPFPDQSFDIVVASQVTHHFSDDDVVRHLSEAWRVARRGIYFSDLHRGPLLYLLIRLLFIVRRFPRHFEADGILSVKRGFRLGELREFARRAGIPNANIQLYFGTRVLIYARK
jgi:Methylase involved in ubiquinone/menaquinone biosynthesis